MNAENHPRKSSSGEGDSIIVSSHSVNVIVDSSSHNILSQQPSIVVEGSSESNELNHHHRQSTSSNPENKQTIHNNHIIPPHSISYSEPISPTESHHVTGFLETPTGRRNPVSVLRSARGNFGSTSSIMATRGKSVASQIGANTTKSTDVISHNTSEPILTINVEVYDNISLLSKYAQSHLGGITTAEAKQILFQSLEETIFRIESRTGNSVHSSVLDVLFRKSPIRGGMLFLLVLFSCLLLYLSGILKFSGIPFYDQYGAIRLVVEASILTFSLLFFFVVTVVSHYRRNRVVISLLKHKFSNLKKHDFNFSMKSKDGNIFEGINMIPYKMIFVLRDKAWSKMPHVLLVKGDLIYTANTKRDLEESHIKYELVDRVGLYRVLETPMSQYIEDSYTDYRNQQEKMPLKIKLNNLISVLTIVAYIGFVLTVICNVIRIGVEGGSYDWITLGLVQPVYVSLVALPIAFPGYWLLCLSASNSRLLSLFEILMKPLKNETSSGHQKRVQITEENRHKPMKIPIGTQLKNFFKVITTANARYYDNLTVLGTITALCFINRTGLLADLLYAPEKILFMKGEDDGRHMAGDIGAVSGMDISEDQYSEINPQTSSKYPQRERRNSTPSQAASVYNNPEDSTDLASEIELKETDKNFKSQGNLGMGDEVDEMVGNVANDEVLPSEPAIPERIEENTNTIAATKKTEKPVDSLPKDELSSHENPSGILVTDVTSHHAIHTEKPEEIITLDVLFDRTASREVDVIRFSDPNWMSHTNSLKPLGLSLLVTGSSPLPDFDKTEGMLDAKSHLWKKYAYLLGKEIGFSDSVIESFSFKKRLHTQSAKGEMSSIIVEYDKQEKQLHSFGDPELLIEYCSDYYSGTDIRPLNKHLKDNILETVKNWRERRDLYCLAISYTPIDQKYEHIVNGKGDIINISRKETTTTVNISHALSPSATPLDEHSEGDIFDSEKYINAAEHMQRGQILLGVAAFRQQPKRDLAEFVRDLQENCGIRFIHFSQYNTQKTKAFGSKIGMEVDWNCCISLNEKEVELDLEDLKAKLPHGIENIRDHLKTVDDVPLLVSLFSDSTPVSTKEMIEVLQENHEVVCCVGSSININNSRSFNQANISVAVDPSTQQHLRPMDFDNLQEEVSDLQEDISPFLSYPCALHITTHQSETPISSFSVIYHLIKEGRKMVHNIRQSLAFLFASCMCLFFIQLLSVVMALPSTLFTGIQFLWLILVIIPLMSFSLLGTPMEPKIMDLISSKNEFKRSKYIWKLLLTMLRFCFPIPAAFVVYFWTIMCMNDTVSISSVGLIWGDQIQPETRQGEAFNSVLTYAQTITMFCLVYYWIFLSIGTMHRVYSIVTVKFFLNPLWWFIIPICLILQALYTFLHIIASRPSNVQTWPNYPFYAYIIILLFPFVFIALDEIIKIRVRRKFFNKQQKAKLMFDTKLGMYSPK
ncbi:hypothetical protein C9374_008971 [Naegleria lovaniensis]|uniref:Cation-transporting P-type ATPase C-terminal domain-containing protein n=1 Tax=Naegleria lovaniensis TaxID=51637 RepID=A0AA88GK25_NAELO|nr:uncharacterized protein C9374_008971 [Naegleria lovaniensis]KAG2377886.1 hypothetical protein C9374_008971 [Naegleria lovaniensis]